MVCGTVESCFEKVPHKKNVLTKKKMYSLNAMQCNWIKASAKCINVNVKIKVCFLRFSINEDGKLIPDPQ